MTPDAAEILRSAPEWAQPRAEEVFDALVASPQSAIETYSESITHDVERTRLATGWGIVAALARDPVAFAPLVGLFFGRPDYYELGNEEIDRFNKVFGPLSNELSLSSDPNVSGAMDEALHGGQGYLYAAVIPEEFSPHTGPPPHRKDSL